jgi:hypothetical protein
VNYYHLLFNVIIKICKDISVFSVGIYHCVNKRVRSFEECDCLHLQVKENGNHT